MKEQERANLKEIVENIQRKELVLPDFQRGFVWDLEMQRRLVASVLARMPLGSILILEAVADDYGCRVLGRKEHIEFEEKNRKLQVLLDGQQRLTVLTNIFSNLLYYDYENEKDVVKNYKSVISKDLKNRFFLRIPCIETLTDKQDLFGLRNLKFALNNPEREEENYIEEPEQSKVFPKFLTEDIRSYIEVRGFDEKSKESYAPHTENPLNIIDDSIKQIDETAYMIPLYLLIDNTSKNVSDKTSNELILGKILEKIVEKVVWYRCDKEYVILDEEAKKKYIEEHINPIFREGIIENDVIHEEKLREKWIKQGCKEWADKLQAYLKFCITTMDLHQIVVPESERERAIDIYENLNLGGITLSTFELVLAKASKIQFEKNQNLYEEILDFSKKSKQYRKDILSDVVRKYYEEFRINHEDYSATQFMECYDRQKHEFRKKYTDVFLNVLSLLCYVPDYDAEKIETGIIKRDKILSLKAEQIHDNYKAACIGIDRAFFFLQGRCGVRKIQEVNYNLMLVLLGYILANEEYYKETKVIDRLEAWYWSSIFSGRYDKDQTNHIMEDICYFLKYLGKQNKEQQWLQERQEKMFVIDDFSDEKTLLLETHTVPKNVLKVSICQFYLAQTYKDLLKDEKIQPFCEEVKELQEHHVVPIGRIDTPYKKMVEARKDKSNLLNSPINFVYITKESNRTIQNQSYEMYRKHCNEESLYKLDFKDCNTEDESQVKELFKMRFEETRTRINQRVSDVLV